MSLKRDLRGVTRWTGVRSREAWGSWGGRPRAVLFRCGVLLVLAVAPVVPLVFPQGFAAFSGSSTNGGNSFSTATSFPTYPAAVGGDGAQFYHRAEDAPSGGGTAADSSGNNRTGVFDGGSDGPRTWWRFNDGSGTTAADAGSVNAGTLTNGPTWGLGPSSGAVVVDGTNDVVLGSGSAVSTNADFTVSAWAYPTATGATRTVVSQDGGTVSGFSLQYTSANKWQMKIPAADSTAGTPDLAVSAVDAVANTWTHLVGVYSDATDLLSLYVDGKLAGTDARSVNWNATGVLTAGRAKTNTATFGEYFQGRIDEVRAYPRALTATEVAALYATPSVKWDFNEGGQSTVADSSGNGNSGSQSGAVWDAATVRSGTHSLQFDGTSDYITTSAVLYTNASFTVSAWAYPTVTGSNRAVVSKFGTAATSFTLKSNGTAWDFAMPVSDTNSPSTPRAISSSSVVLNTWTHLVAVYDASAAQVRLYVNGVLEATTASVTGWNATGQVNVGRNQFNGGAVDYWQGNIDDFRAYDHALGSEDIAQLYREPAARYELNDGAGTTAEDSSGNYRNATLSGATWSTAGHRDKALAFDGSSQYASANAVLDTTNSYTVSAWAYLTDNTGYRKVVSQDGPIASIFALGYDLPSNKWTFVTRDAAGGNDVGPLSASTVTLNRWVHLVGVYDDPANQLRLYVNGALSNSATQSVDGATSGPLLIGAGKWSGSRVDYWQGRIDEVNLYDRVLTAADIAALYNETPKAAWDLDEGSGTSTTDRSGNGYTGTLAGGTSWTASGQHGTNAVTFNGSSGIITATAPLNTTISYTASVWVYLTNNAGYRKVLTQEGPTAAIVNIGYDDPLDKWIIETRDAAVGNYKYAVSNSVAATNQWVHLVGVYDDPADQVRLYVNGVLNGSVTQTVDAATTGSLLIGADKWAGSRGAWWQGNVDEVRVYQRVLNADEIAALYANTQPNAAPDQTHVPSARTGAAGALQGPQQGQQATTAAAFHGIGNAYNPTQYTNPTSLTVECWFKVPTGNTLGGPLIGFANTTTGSPTSYDRTLYITDSQQVRFGVWTGSLVSITSSALSTGVWHHVAASLGPAGMKLYVDGTLAAANTGTTTAQNITGYWRFGGTGTGGWPNINRSYLTGFLDEIAVFHTQLTDQQISWHYHANH